MSPDTLTDFLLVTLCRLTERYIAIKSTEQQKQSDETATIHADWTDEEEEQRRQLFQNATKGILLVAWKPLKE